MKDLEKAREQIDLIDKQMAKLFEERMQAVKEVAEFKKANGLAIFDKSREDKILQSCANKISDKDLDEYYVDYVKNVIRISKNYQSKLMGNVKVAYSGTEGAFGYLAAKQLYPMAEYIAYPHFAGAYKAVEDGEVDLAVLPIENSSAGDVGIVMDLTFSGNLYINRVIDMSVSHCLLGLPNSTINDIKTVVSHSQALEQCDEFIKENNFKTSNYVNTALAAKYVLENNDASIGAIASKETAESLGLKVLAVNVNNDKNNTTRFAVFSRSQTVPAKDVKDQNQHFILTFTTKNQAGTLATALNIIGAHNFNMRNLRSRPMKDLMWNYYFFIEADGNINSYDGQNMLKELSAVCARLKLVGTYN